MVPSLEVGYVWHAGVHAAEVAAGLERIGFEIVRQVICQRRRRVARVRVKRVALDETDVARAS